MTKDEIFAAILVEKAVTLITLTTGGGQRIGV